MMVIPRRTLLGVSEIESNVNFWKNIIHPDDELKVIKALKAHLEWQTTLYDCENRLRMKSGEYRWNLGRGKVVARDPDGKPLRMVGTDTDITERKQAEKENINLAKFPSENPNPVLRITKDGKVLYSNEAGEQLLSEWSSGVGEKVPEKWCNLIAEAFASEKDTEEEKEEVKDKIFSFTIAPVKEAGYVNLYARDITKRKQAEKTLRKETEIRKQLLDSLPCTALIIKKGTREIVFSNKISHLMLGVNLKKTCYETYADREDPCPWCLAPEVWETNEVRKFEPYYRGKHYEGIWIPLDEETYGHFIFDITERKEAEKEILEKQKQLRDLTTQLSLSQEHERKRIAEGLHDDIIQPLIFLDVKLKTFLDSGANSELMDSYKRMREIIKKLIGDVRDFTFDLSYPVLHELGFEKAVRQWLISEIKKKHGLKTVFKDDRKNKPLDKDIQTLLFKAVKELLVNMVKHAKASKVKVALAKDKDNIVVCVEDDGVGFSVEKAISKISGFGLFNIRDRIDHLGGSFEIKSEPGSGTKAVITMPLRQLILKRANQ